MLVLTVTVNPYRACDGQFWRLDIPYILGHKSQRRGGGLPSNTSWQPTLVSCEFQNALRVDYYINDLSPQNR